jgi:drug/metabolite transporter (DMT)-like permease
LVTEAAAPDRKATLPDPAPRRAGLGGDSPLRAVLYMSLASLLFPVLNASVKYLGTRYPMPEIFWARYAGHAVFCLVALLPRFGLALLRTRRPAIQAWRAVLLFSASGFYFFGLKTISLPTASAISFAGPMLVTALSVPMLREKVGLRRWLAIIVGFCGALVIIRPGSDVVQWGAVLVLCDVACYAVYQILSRQIGAIDRAEVSITLAGIGGVALATTLLPFTDLIMPEGMLDWTIFVFLGLWGLLGHLFVVKAYQWGSVGIVAPFCYVELVGATIFGLALFGDFPDAWTWVGAAIIVASGLYITLREHKLRRMGRI